MTVLLALLLGLVLGFIFGYLIGIYVFCWLIDNGKSSLYTKKGETK